MSHSKVQVNLKERGYEILIGTGVLGSAGNFIAERTGCSQAVIITDKNVESPYATAVRDHLVQQNIHTDLLTVEAGEPSKSVDVANRLWNSLLDLGADRQTVVIAVGGGVVGDLAGFIAATFTRGIEFFQIPTTLLAQVDSSVGGKVGVNLPNAKNIVGAFWQPRGVLIDIAALRTLPVREYRAGMAEVVKYGVILDDEFFAYLESNLSALNDRQPQVLEYVVARCCQLKADVVEADEREQSGMRAKLNYGHTFCHAFEAVTGYREFLHGEAVSMGMICASRLAEELGMIDSTVTQRQFDLLTALGLPVAPPELDQEKLLEAMKRDKKTERGQLRFVLPSRLGEVDLVAGIDRDQVLSVLAP